MDTREILSKAQSSYIPKYNLVVYKNTKTLDYYVNMHNIDKMGRMGAGFPLSTRCITEIAGKFSKEEIQTPHGTIPENMIFVDNRINRLKYVWYRPPERRMMYFAKDLNIPDDFYHVPGLLYVVNDKKLNIYAYKGKKPNSQLYYAPFFNVTNGSVCIGSPKIKCPESPTFEEFIKYWEEIFWKTEFSHLGGNTNPTKDNLVVVTKKSKESFDYNQLKKSNTLLKDILR